MRKLRVAVLMHDYLVPPEDVSGHDLMAVQWAAAVIAATVLSPSTWNGSQASLHPHVTLAVLLGGVITALPALLAWRYPGRAVTRYTIVVAQCAFSALLIQVTGGRIELFITIRHDITAQS